MQNDLATWILEQREKGVCLDQYEIQIKAVHFYDLIHPVFNSGDILPIVVSIVQPQPQESYEDSSKKD